MKDNITLEATGEFPFKFYIEKALPIEEGEELVLEGIASTTNVDHDKERMSVESIKQMCSVINEKSVPLRVEHSKDDSAIIGSVRKAWVDDRNQLHVRAYLDKSHPVSSILHSSMKQGVKMGLSVGGVVKRAVKEFVESVGNVVKTFYDVQLNEVSVTPRPANYDSWLVAKSIAKSESEGDSFRNSAFYNDFLFQNPSLDYLQVFAKSVPDKEWKKVDSLKNNNTNKIMKDVTKKTDDETTEKTVSRGEFDALKSVIEKGFEAMTGFMTKMASGAKDTTNPNKEKPDPEKVTAKASDKKEDEDTTKAKDDTDETKEKAKKEDEDTTKAKDDDDDTKEKASTEDYKLDTVERAIKSMETITANLTKKADKEDMEDTTKASDEKTDETKEKASDKETDDDKTEKGAHPLDQFVLAVVKAMEAVSGKLEKSGKQVLGFNKHIVDTIKNDPELQAEIGKMMKIPGFKKSVSMGVPYMVTKDGRRFALTATETGTTVEKSRGDALKGKTFKDVYKSEYSSVKAEE